MKKSVMIVIIILVAISLFGCIYFMRMFTLNHPEEEVEYMTEEEFIHYIETHAVGVTMKDFEGIDLDDFIRTYYCIKGREFNPDFDFRNAIDWYWYEIEAEENEQYNAYELKTADSTGKEFEAFAQSFIDKIEQKGWIITSYESDGSYAIKVEIDDEKYMDIRIAQTENLILSTSESETEKFKLIEGNREDKEPARLDFGDYEFAMKNHQPEIYYNKTEQYFMYFTSGTALREHFEVIKIFCENE